MYLMNQKLHKTFFVLIWFLLSIFLFIFSDNYRYFLQSLKHDKLDYKHDEKLKISITQNYENNPDIRQQNDLFTWLSDNVEIKKVNIKKQTNNKKTIKTETKQEQTIKQVAKKDKIEKKVEFSDSKEKNKLTNIEKLILKKFEKYKLKKIDLHPRLFDLTWEYPDEYFEYYAKDINLYFFWNKLYSDIKDIFEVLTYELPFSINEVNNFWEKSFYINLNPWFNDNHVRIVIKKSNRMIWLKIRKELYEKMKKELWTIFSKTKK